MDAVSLAVETLKPILPVAVGHYDGVADQYAVVSEVDVYDDYTDDGASLNHTTVQVDIWGRGMRPVAIADQTQAALEGADFLRMRRGGAVEVDKGEAWHRMSYDYEYTQEVE